MLNDIPYAEELDPHVNRKGSLELETQLDALRVIPRVHIVRERQLFEVAGGNKSHFLKHSREGAGCKSATRETKNTDLIPGAIWSDMVSFSGR